jgi:hypothetical protein
MMAETSLKRLRSTGFVLITFIIQIVGYAALLAVFPHSHVPPLVVTMRALPTVVLSVLAMLAVPAVLLGRAMSPSLPSPPKRGLSLQVVKTVAGRVIPDAGQPESLDENRLRALLAAVSLRRMVTPGSPLRDGLGRRSRPTQPVDALSRQQRFSGVHSNPLSVSTVTDSTPESGCIRDSISSTK